MNYDPNVRFCTQVVELKLAQWDYRATVVVKVGGNVKGIEVLRAASESLWQQLEEVDGVKRIALKRRNDVLYCEDDGDTDWPQDLIISARITEVIPDASPAGAAKLAGG